MTKFENISHLNLPLTDWLFWKIAASSESSSIISLSYWTLSFLSFTLLITQFSNGFPTIVLITLAMYYLGNFKRTRFNSGSANIASGYISANSSIHSILRPSKNGTLICYTVPHLILVLFFAAKSLKWKIVTVSKVGK